ncbi:hypothetical protein CVT26_013599 [Gymnopilus dilepis]|uniref:Methyltransferase domain-containing protein n=1 Tax=Gymnopilus dilepis TaxID=231916 RepID=A0A409Y5U5_9AGAR|nr:hypothetical protein CVT26_013599 [Gymnopilus dilepis]
MTSRSATLLQNVPTITTTRQRSKRRPGETPYPVKYSRQMADFDIWDHMFLTNYLGSLTIHRFPTPPSVVLDLGCGSGYWDSKFYGLDIVDIQPRLEQLEHHKSLARRIEWVHGDFLDGLPFESDYFDFVRIAGLGLAIPEDDWQPVLEEVYRVMKPGAALEVRIRVSLPARRDKI